jgi:hypothetical protein
MNNKQDVELLNALENIYPYMYMPHTIIIFWIWIKYLKIKIKKWNK